VCNARKTAPSPEENLLLKLVQAISDGQLSPEEGVDVASSVDARRWQPWKYGNVGSRRWNKLCHATAKSIVNFLEGSGHTALV